jgi:MHS family proline/betaine transporter-like MFS transporter
VPAVIGALLEAFDLTVYGLVSLTIGQVFFPSHSHTQSLLMAYSTFSISFLMRPLGAAIIGTYGDRHGRRAALSMSLRLMGIGTAAIALMPGFRTLGVAASCGVILGRLIQGFAAGGEGGSAITFLAEQWSDRRGLALSSVFAVGGVAFLAAFGIVAWLTSITDSQQWSSWGWRIPFFIGALIWPVGLYIRRRAWQETFRTALTDRAPLRAVLGHDLCNFIAALHLYALSPALVYAVVYLPTYSIRELALSPRVSFSCGIASGIAMIVVSPLCGWLTDRIDQKRILRALTGATTLLVWPLFAWLSVHPTSRVLIFVQTVLIVIAAFHWIANAALLTRIFPPDTRTTAIALSGSLSFAIYGGLTPTICTALVSITGMKSSPGIYLSAIALLSLVGLMFIRNPHRELSDRDID